MSFSNIVRYWWMLPLAARRYIVYMSLSIPILFAWILIPYLMLATGLDVAEAGMVLSIASGIAAIVNAVVGRVLEKAEPVVFIALIGFIEGIAYLMYMHGFLLALLLLVVLGAAIERIARGFYTAFAVYEYDVYPEEIRDKAFTLYNFVSFLVQVATYPLIGWLLGVVIEDIVGRILSLLFFSIASIALGLLALAWLPRVGKKRIEFERLSLRASISARFLSMVLAVVAFGIGMELSQPLIVANLFMHIAGNPLLGLALYETFAAIPVPIVSTLLLSVDRRHGVRLLALGMALLGLSDIVLGLSRDIGMALLSALMASAGYALMDPYFMDTLFSTIPRELRGTLLGGIASIRRLLGIAMPGIAGMLASLNTYLPFFVAAASIFTSMGLTLRVALSVKKLR